MIPVPLLMVTDVIIVSLLLIQIFNDFHDLEPFFLAIRLLLIKKIKQLNSGDKYCDLQHFVLFFISGAPREKRAS